MDIKILASGSDGNACRISDGATQILLDAGISMRELRRGLDFSVCSLSACLITHLHGDHCKAAGDVLRAGVPIYTGQATIDACGLCGHNVHVVKPLEPFTVGTLTILPFDVEHDVPDALGFAIKSAVTGEKILYFTDTFYIKYRFNGITHILGECNYAEDIIEENVSSGYVADKLAPRIVKSHMSLANFIEFLKANDKSKLKAVYLLHLSSANADPARFCDEVRRVTGTEVYAG